MNTEHLVHDLNQICAFFNSYPHDEAVTLVEDHLRKFWAPSMRSEIVRYLASGGSGISDMGTEAVTRLG